MYRIKQDLQPWFYSYFMQAVHVGGCSFAPARIPFVEDHYVHMFVPSEPFHVLVCSSADGS